MSIIRDVEIVWHRNDNMNVYLNCLFCFIGSLFITIDAHADSMTLQQAWIQAYQSNPSLEAERAKLRATDEQVSQALSHWRPSIDATSNT